MDTAPPAPPAPPPPAAPPSSMSAPSRRLRSWGMHIATFDCESDKQVVVDYFVHNCVVAPGDDAFKVKVYVDGLAYGNPVNDWVSLSMGVPPTARIRLALVNPLGEELARPAFNCAERQPAEERAERAALGGPDDSSSARGGKK